MATRSLNLGVFILNCYKIEYICVTMPEFTVTILLKYWPVSTITDHAKCCSLHSKSISLLPEIVTGVILSFQHLKLYVVFQLMVGSCVGLISTPCLPVFSSLRPLSCFCDRLYCISLFPPDFPESVLVDFLLFATTSVEFNFDDIYWHIKGVTMGSPLGPS